MPLVAWLQNNWLNIAQTASLVACIFLLRNAINAQARIRQLGNSIQLSEHHRTLWERLLVEPQLGRILCAKVDLGKKPITPAEEMFVVFIILHLSDTFFSMQTGYFEKPTGLRQDVTQLFSLPIPNAVWKKFGNLQEPQFAQFVDECLDWAEEE